MSAPAPPSDNLYVTNLPHGLDENMVSQFFAIYGNVQQCRVLPCPVPNGKTAALVRFASIDEATSIMRTLNGQVLTGLSEPVQIKYATPKKGKGEGKGKDSKDAVIPAIVAPPPPDPSVLLAHALAVQTGMAPTCATAVGSTPDEALVAAAAAAIGDPTAMAAVAAAMGMAPTPPAPPPPAIDGAFAMNGGLDNGIGANHFRFLKPAPMVERPAPYPPALLGNGTHVGPDLGGAGLSGGFGGLSPDLAAVTLAGQSPVFNPDLLAMGFAGGAFSPEMPFGFGGLGGTDAFGLQSIGKGADLGMATVAPVQEPEVSDKVYVQGLPPDTSSDSVHETFMEFGTVLSIQLLSKGKTVPCAALIKYKSSESATLVKDILSGSQPEGFPGKLLVKFVVDGHIPEWEGSGNDNGKGKESWQLSSWEISEVVKFGSAGGEERDDHINGEVLVDMIYQSGALPGGKRYICDNAAIYISGLPWDTTSCHLYKLFAPFGAIHSCTAKNGGAHGHQWAIGFVNYLDPLSADVAIKLFHGMQLPDGNMLKVAIANKRKHAGDLLGT